MYERTVYVRSRADQAGRRGAFLDIVRPYPIGFIQLMQELHERRCEIRDERRISLHTDSYFPPSGVSEVPLTREQTGRRGCLTLPDGG